MRYALVYAVLASALAACQLPLAAAPTGEPAVAGPSTTVALARAESPAVAVPAVAVGPSGPPPDPNTVAVPPPGSCHIANGLPDPACTPGLSNPDVTKATMTQNICNRLWSTKTIRPPVSYTDVLKKRLMQAYGLTDSPANYELDHDISLEVGGASWASANLWPEPRRITGAEPNAEEKDVVENQTHQRICAGLLDLDVARAQMAADWTKLRTVSASLTPEPTVEPEP